MTVASTPTRVAILGTGAIAQVVHLPILTRMRGVDVAGVFDADGAKAAIVADRFRAPHVYRAIDEIWGDDSIDAIVICTPNNLHEEQVIQGLIAGKYVFCEKPLALSADGVRRVLYTGGDSGRLMVGMNQRFHPDAMTLYRFLQAGELGDVQHVRAGLLNRRVSRSPRGWRLRKAGAGGGALMDLGVQMLDLCLWLLDYPAPRRLVCHLRSLPGSEVEDSAVLLLEAADGRVVTVEVTWALVADRERHFLQVIADRGSGSFPPLQVFKDTEHGLLDASPQAAPRKENQFTASYRQELAFFADAVRGRRTIDTPAEQVLLMKIIENAYRSAAEQSEIRF